MLEENPFLNINIFAWRDITHPSAGGGTLYIHEVAKSLVRYDHNVTILCGNYSINKIKGKTHDKIDGVNIIRLGNKYSAFLVAPYYYMTKIRSNIDLVIDQIIGIPWFTPIYVKKPKVVIIHQLVGKIFFTEPNVLVAIIGYILERLIPLIYVNTRFITVSKSVKKDLVAFGIKEEYIHVIPPGINSSLYQIGVKSSTPLILYVGRLKKYKGIQTLLKSMKIVHEKIPNARLSIVGKGDYLTELMRITKSLKLQDVVTFHGYVPEDEKIRHMQKAHILVYPSTGEGWGIPVIEANACGTPVIASDVTGLRDSVIDGHTGLLFSLNDYRELTEKIVFLLENKKYWYSLSKGAVQWSKNFSWEKINDKIKNIFKYEIDASKGARFTNVNDVKA